VELSLPLRVICELRDIVFNWRHYIKCNILPLNDHYELVLDNVVCKELLASPKKRYVLHARQQETSGLTTQLQEIGGQYKPANNLKTAALTFKQQSTDSAHSQPPISKTTLYIISAICPVGSECTYLKSISLSIEFFCRYTVNVKVNQGIVDALRIVDYQGFSYARFAHFFSSLTPF